MKITKNKAKKKDFNVAHPELKEGEVFIYTATKLGYQGIKKQWKTVRKGKIAYTTEGKKMSKEYFPVFVNIKEKEKKALQRNQKVSSEISKIHMLLLIFKERSEPCQKR